MQRVAVGQETLSVEIQGSGPPLLLVHGFPLDHTMWKHQIEELADQFQVIAPDLRGFGASALAEPHDLSDEPGPSGQAVSAITMEQYADELVGMLDALRIDQPVAFCGLSMGGYIGWQFLMRHADRLDRLIMCDTKAVADSPQVKQVRMETAERVLQEGPGFLAELMRDRLFSPTSLRDKPTAVEATQQVIRDTNPRAIAAALYGMAERPDMRDRLPSIDVPSLLIGGELDVISPAEEMRGIAQSMPNAKFIPIPQAGHMAPLERPQEVNSAIREFLSDWV